MFYLYAIINPNTTIKLIQETHSLWSWLYLHSLDHVQKMQILQGNIKLHQTTYRKM